MTVLRFSGHAHELVDDLESLFWVLLYGALKYFVPSPQTELIDSIFYREYIDRNGRWQGAEGKVQVMYYESFDMVSLTSPFLESFIHDLRSDWYAYHIAGSGDLDQSPDQYDLVKHMLPLAPDPQHWIHKFSQALRQFDAESSSSRASAGPPHLSAGPALRLGRTGSSRPGQLAQSKPSEDKPSPHNIQVRRGIKRKAEDAHKPALGPRRSKRLRKLLP